MDVQLQQANKLLFQVQSLMGSLGRETGDQLLNLENEIQSTIEQLFKQSKRLEELLFKEPAQRKQSSKLKVDQVIYDARHFDSSFKNYLSRKRRKEEEARQREELMSTSFTTNAESHDTKIAMDYALDHNSALQNADRSVSDLLDLGSNALSQMRNQGSSLKGVRKRILDIGNTLGLSNTVMRMIDKRGTQDKWIVYGGMILTCIIMFLAIKYLT